MIERVVSDVAVGVVPTCVEETMMDVVWSAVVFVISGVVIVGTVSTFSVDTVVGS